MSILIKGIDMPKYESLTIKILPSGAVRDQYGRYDKRVEAVEVPKHGRLIDADALRAGMYHEAFETDSELQRWDSGCWVRYKMFENHMDNAPTIIEAEE